MLPSFADALKGSQAFLSGDQDWSSPSTWVGPTSHPSPLARKKKNSLSRLVSGSHRIQPWFCPSFGSAKYYFLCRQTQVSLGADTKPQERGKGQRPGVKDPSPATTLNDQLTKLKQLLGSAYTCKAAENQWKVAVNNTDVASLGQGTAPTPKCSQCPPGQLKKFKTKIFWKESLQE